MFVGITVLAHGYAVVPTTAESGVSQLGRAIFGRGVIYYLLQAATMMILCWRRTRRTPTSRGLRRSSPATAICPASS